MYRVDKYDHVRSHSGFPYPPLDTVYYTGSGGLHFWVELADAVAYTKENNLHHFFASPRVPEQAVIPWSRELMREQPVHLVPTLVLSVGGYSAPRRMRNELVLPGRPPLIYTPSLVMIIV